MPIIFWRTGLNFFWLWYVKKVKWEMCAPWYVLLLFYVRWLLYLLWQYRLWSFTFRDTKSNIFCLKMKSSKGFFDIFLNKMLESLQNLGPINKNKLLLNMTYMKSTNNKSCTFSEKLCLELFIRTWFFAKIFQNQMLKVKIGHFFSLKLQSFQIKRYWSLPWRHFRLKSY